MARSARRRESHRTAVVGGRAEIIVPLEELALQTRATRWFGRVGTERSDDLATVGSTVSVVFDPFSFTLFVTDQGEAVEITGTHDGPAFHEAAVRMGSVDVFVTSGLDVRRSKPPDFSAAAASGAMLGARVDAFAVQTL